MSISDGQRVRATESNAAWASKSADNTFTGQQTLNHTGSGTQVTDVQQAINDNISDIATNASDISALDTRVTTAEADIVSLEENFGLADEAGTSETIAAPAAGTVRLTNAILPGVGKITGGASGEKLVIINETGNDVPIRNNDVQYGILTGTGDDVTIVDGQAIALVYNGTDERWHVVGGTGSGGSGGSVQVELFPLAQSPAESDLNDFKVYEFEDALSQYLYINILVPNDYTAGETLTLKGSFISPISTGTVLIQALTTYIDDGELSTSTTNQHTSTNSAIDVSADTSGDGTIFTVSLDLTDGSGQVNSQDLTANARLKVRLTRDTANDTMADIAYLIKHGWEVVRG